MVNKLHMGTLLIKSRGGDTPSVTAPHKDQAKDGSLAQILLQKSLHVKLQKHAKRYC
jgi:hypothetical protein